MIKSLLERKAEGKIINIVSDVAFYGSLSGHADYAASKGGVVAFSHSIAREYANMGININCVAPGFMSTKMTREILAKDKNAVCHRIPINRIADPKEIADVVVFLGSKRASYITASTVNVTGGLLIR
jgi:3-oxoacyl-[acyl-carrier protein] reductase